MTYHTILCCICEMKDVTMAEAQAIVAEEQAKGAENYNDFLERIGDWYFNL